jgi:serine/threonine protein kinase
MLAERLTMRKIREVFRLKFDCEISNRQIAKTTQTGISLSSAYYLSPEQLKKPFELDHRTDLYSLGVVLYELAAGKLPFGGDNIHSVFKSIIEDSPSAIEISSSPIAPILSHVIFRSLEKEPENRFSSAAELTTTLTSTELSAKSMDSKSYWGKKHELLSIEGSSSDLFRESSLLRPIGIKIPI